MEPARAATGCAWGLTAQARGPRRQLGVLVGLSTAERLPHGPGNEASLVAEVLG